MRRTWIVLIALCCMASAAWAQGPAAALKQQKQQKPAAAEKAAAPQASPQASPGASPQASPAQGADTGQGSIDQILEGEEEVMQGTGYSYDPGNRRDPFKSLLVAPERPKFGGPRPEGVPGLLIDEIDVTGIFYKPSLGWVAQIQASNKEKSYLIKPGDQLYDGDVISISKNEVVFKQIVNDPTALKPFREVVKKLNP